MEGTAESDFSFQETAELLFTQNSAESDFSFQETAELLFMQISAESDSSVGRTLQRRVGISIQSETKRNGSKIQRNEIAKKMISFACFALKQNRKCCMTKQNYSKRNIPKKKFIKIQAYQNLALRLNR